MNRRILIEELPDGQMVISTNFSAGRPTAEMSAAKISMTTYGLGNDLRELLEEPIDDRFQQGMRKLAWDQMIAKRKARGEMDDIPF